MKKQKNYELLAGRTVAIDYATLSGEKLDTFLQKPQWILNLDFVTCLLVLDQILLDRQAHQL